MFMDLSDRVTDEEYEQERFLLKNIPVPIRQLEALKR